MIVFKAQGTDQIFGGYISANLQKEGGLTVSYVDDSDAFLFNLNNL